jgi:uncharacterized protein YfaS (alpha-2-macroglobulin family)
MAAKWKIRVLSLLILTAAIGWKLSAEPVTAEEQREILAKKYKDGNYKEAYDGLRKLALDPKDDPLKVSWDLDTAIDCLSRLGRVDEFDEFRESVIKVHQKNWRLLQTAAVGYVKNTNRWDEHYGFIVAGKFKRGQNKGATHYVNVMPRDRVRALQLMQEALELTRSDKDKSAVAQFCIDFAGMLLNGVGRHEPWRLQYLSDLSKLPDFSEGDYYHTRAGAPVDADGNPIYHHVPKSYETAQTDGERWRWLLTQAAELDPSRLNEAELVFAEFLTGQFDVQTMDSVRIYNDDNNDKKTGTFAMHTLGDDETIARLATGIKRFKLPDEFNFNKIYDRIASRGKSTSGASALTYLASSYEDRRQYVKAADVWKRAIADYGPGDHNARQERLTQIVGNWGRFESGAMQPAGISPTIEYRYRNGNKVEFQATEINVTRLLDDVKAYLGTSPNQLDYQKIDISSIGHRLVDRNETQYLGAKAAEWIQELKPRPAHVDERITVTAPLKKPGAYLVSAKMAGGNTSRIIVWIADTVILKKQLENQAYYFVADAVTGHPVPNASLEFFGYRQEQINPNANQYRTLTTGFSETADKDGQVIVGKDKQPGSYQWLVTARQKKEGGDRFAYLGFTHVWYHGTYDSQYNATRVFTITDRPVYRPEQTAQFKVWVRHAKYDEPDTSDFAGQTFNVVIMNPKGEKVLEKSMVADEYGGLAGEHVLPKNTMLGVYHFSILKPGNAGVYGGGYFRVEEYKKPEFEVTIEAPKEPVSLGDTITATIQAKYYFGAPVTHAKVKYTVTRNSYTTQWYPKGDWDWFYGKGYWWFAGEYSWYPGFADWGMRRPRPIWWGRDYQPPETVLENEVPIAADGTVKVSIDTTLAKELHGDQDHKYSITAEVVDESRRTIVGTGEVLVARKPFKVYTWLDRGHYRAGDTIKASFAAQTLDQKPVQGKGEAILYKITYDDKAQPVEKAVETWKLDTDEQGKAKQQMKAAQPGQYRLLYKVTDAKGHTIEGAYLFTVRGDGFDGKDFRFNDLELITDKREYAPGDKVKLMVNTNKNDSVVLLFARPTNGVYLPPQVRRLQGKSAEEEIAVVQRDMPNFFIEAVTIADGRVHSEVREVIVPPEKRILNVEVVTSQAEYKPGEKANVKIKLTDHEGKAFVGSTAITMYDKSVEYIAGGSNVPEIKEFFWKWRRSHHPSTESSLSHWFGQLLRRNETGMSYLGRFGESAVLELGNKHEQEMLQLQDGMGGGRGGAVPKSQAAAGAAAEPNGNADAYRRQEGGEQQLRERDGKPGENVGAPPLVEPTIRRNFADTAFWSAHVTTDKNGLAEFSVGMPDNLTAWRIRVWGMGHGTKVGQGEATVTTKKDLIVRLQSPRFFTQKDEVVLSANVHNYLKKAKQVTVSLEMDGGCLEAIDKLTQVVMIPAGDEKRVDWRVKAKNEGSALVRMKAQSDEDSDAMEMRFPVYVHGMLKMESYTGVIPSSAKDGASSTITLNVPADRRVNQTVLEVRYSPTLAGAMIDALPYMVDYPYGCTEQTLNRFLPTVITQRLLQSMKLDLKEIQKHKTNLNSQELGNDKDRIKKGWELARQGGNRSNINPVFDVDEVNSMTNAGIQALQNMQLSDGGWGWFSGYGERSSAHTTATVVHGLQIAKASGVKLPDNMLERGLSWLRNYQSDHVIRLSNAPTKTHPWKEHADNLDAFVYMVLADSAMPNQEMRDFLFRDRTHISVYAKAMFGLALLKDQQKEKLDVILQNIEQYVVQDEENQTAYLRLPADNQWWNWYGSETEANAYYLKLLALTNPKDLKAPRLVKYLLNNRRHATYWNSTRDTALCIEAMAEYLKASGEDRPDMTIEVWLDGKKHKEVHIDEKNLFYFDNRFVLLGDAVENGKHTLEIKRKGTGPVYFNAYLTNFTTEDFITKAGLEVRVNRKYYKLTPVIEKVKVPGSRNQALDQKVTKYERTELANLAELKSGDLVEVELEIDSKNDYEYILFEDPKAAGFEPVSVRSGYTRDGMSAYMELRDERVCFFVRQLPRGKNSISYRLRAEIPGQFSALPARASAMYAPELKGNSDEIKLRIRD